ncbi:alpha/beta fold hydrolase [Micromonospora mangrovi]|uniref:Alpha/beta hydrolase n=2 Tax=Micromonospora TaxID=1873 RepID=A0AAU8HG18_9ACTN
MDRPVVVLCAGMAEGADTWDALVPLLADTHRVVRFDRPGLGGSGPVGPPPTLAGEVARLAALVGREVGRPVLVAHSAAALPAEAYARTHPDRLAGLVLVDPSVVPATPAAGRCRARLARRVAAHPAVPGRVLDRTGLARLGPPVWRWVRRRRATDPPTSALRAAGERRYGSAAVLLTVLVEWLAYPAMAAALARLRRRSAPPVVPVVVLTALADVPGRRARAAWRAGHAALARSFPAGRQELLPDARHLVQWDDPEAVRAAIVAVGRDTGS